MNKKVFIEKIAVEVKKLPPVPATIHKLRVIINNPETDYSHIIPILSKDPGLCADLLRFSNSAMFGLNHKVTTLEEAIRCFGMANLADYVLSAFCDQAIRQCYNEHMDLDEYFKHSRHVAEVCKVLGQMAKLSVHEQETFSVAGLLHDIGRLVMLLVARREHLVLLGTSWGKLKHVIRDSEDSAGIDHCDVSRIVCHKWKYPEILSEGIGRHHTPILKDDVNVLGSYIFLAHFVGFEQLDENMILAMFPNWALEHLNLSAEKLLEARAICFDNDI